MIRRTLRWLAFVLVVLVPTVAVLVFVATRTPLPARRPSAQATVDLAAYRAGRLQVPGARWELVDPDRLGWSTEALEGARQFAERLDSGAVMVVHRGVLVAEWGDAAARTCSQSIRKSLLSALFGELVRDGRLRLDATLAELGIDDDPPLDAAERGATVRDLLLSRSGVYHSALYEAGSWKRRKPARGADAPGERWFYNNWGFNALGTIYASVAGRPIGEAFAARIASPTGMQDYRPQDVVLLTREHLSERAMGNRSDHAAYVFLISARDLARFGLLVLADGRWGGQAVLPPGWVRESTFDAALPTGWDDSRYGYMWWVMPADEVVGEPRLVARGGMGHQLIVLPRRQLVVVHRVPDRGVGLASQLFRRFVWHPAVSDQQIDELLRRILAAYPEGGAEVSAAARNAAGVLPVALLNAS